MMNRREELNVAMMEQVNGGSTKYYHEGCGGTLWHAGNINPFLDVECSKCHEKHRLTNSFKKVIYTSDDGTSFWWQCGNEERDDRYYGDTSIYQ